MLQSSCTTRVPDLRIATWRPNQNTDEFNSGYIVYYLFIYMEMYSSVIFSEKGNPIPFITSLTGRKDFSYPKFYFTLGART